MHKKHLVAALLALATSCAMAQQSPAPTAAPKPEAHHDYLQGEPVTVTREQFLARAAQQFDRMDINKDGKLTPDEHVAARQARDAAFRSRGPEHRPPPPGFEDGAPPHAPKQ